MLLVRLGNDRPIEGYKEIVNGVEQTFFRDIEGPAETIAKVQRATIIDGETKAGIDGYTPMELLKAITDPKGIVANHFRGVPTWVDCNDEGLEILIASQYGCRRLPPDDMEETHHTHQGPPGVGENYSLEYVDPPAFEVYDADQLREHQISALGLENHPIEVDENGYKVLSPAERALVDESDGADEKRSRRSK